MYRVHHKHLPVFEIWKLACPLSATSILTVIMYSDVWSLVDMGRRSVLHRIAAVELFIKTEFVTAIQRGLRQHFQRRDVPTRSALLLWASKWRQKGSAMDSKAQGSPLSARAPDNVESVRDATLRSPCRSARP